MADGDVSQECYGKDVTNSSVNKECFQIHSFIYSEGIDGAIEGIKSCLTSKCLHQTFFSFCPN